MSEINLLLDEIKNLKRRIQALETVTEHPGFAASDVARLSVANTFAGIQTIPNTGLHILDTNASHDLIIAPGSNLTADRTLTIVTGDADRSVTVPASGTLALLESSNTFTGQQTIESTSNPAARITRSVASTTGLFAPLAVMAKSTGDMTDGFGVRIALQAEDTGGTFNFGAFSAERVNGTDNDGKLVFSSYSGGTRQDAMTILPNKHMLINTTSDLGQLAVNQSVTTAAIPVLYINQADVDQPLMELATTIGTGNAIEAIGSKTLTTTHFAMVKIPGGLTRYFPVGTIA